MKADKKLLKIDIGAAQNTFTESDLRFMIRAIDFYRAEMDSSMVNTQASKCIRLLYESVVKISH